LFATEQQPWPPQQQWITHPSWRPVPLWPPQPTWPPRRSWPPSKKDLLRRAATRTTATVVTAPAPAPALVFKPDPPKAATATFAALTLPTPVPLPQPVSLSSAATRRPQTRRTATVSSSAKSHTRGVTTTTTTTTREVTRHAQAMDDWEVRMDPRGNTYLYDPQTKITITEHPFDHNQEVRQIQHNAARSMALRSTGKATNRRTDHVRDVEQLASSADSNEQQPVHCMGRILLVMLLFVALVYLLVCIHERTAALMLFCVAGYGPLELLKTVADVANDVLAIYGATAFIYFNYDATAQWVADSLHASAGYVKPDEHRARTTAGAFALRSWAVVCTAVRSALTRASALLSSCKADVRTELATADSGGCRAGYVGTGRGGGACDTGGGGAASEQLRDSPRQGST